MSIAPGPKLYRAYQIQDEVHEYTPINPIIYHKIRQLQFKNKIIIMNATPMKSNNNDIQELKNLLGLDNISMQTISTQSTEQLGQDK